MNAEPGRITGIVETGYDIVAEQYLATKRPDDPVKLAELEEMVHELPPDATVLDLGCGAGVPATRWLSERFAVTGVDVSARQWNWFANTRPPRPSSRAT